MNIKKIFRSWVYFVLLFPLFFCKTDYIFAAARFTITSPSSEITFSENLAIEGSVLNLNENYIRLKIEPFIEKKDFKTAVYLLPVNNRKFKKNIILPQGISLITITTLDNRTSVSKPILFFSSGKNLQEGNLGQLSPIKFYEPKELKVSNPNISIKGEVSDRSLKNIDVVVINLTEFQRLNSNRNALSGLAYKNVEMENNKFTFSQTLNPGINLAIARPLGRNSAQLTQTKVIIFEELSPKINLSEPRIKNKKLLVEGSVGDISLSPVVVRVEALVKNDESSMPSLKNVFEKTVNIEEKNKFNINIDLEGIKGLFDSSYFLVSVFSGKERTVRLIVK